jgi:cbb3-type cytochrome oxidase subunit 3
MEGIVSDIVSGVILFTVVGVSGYVVNFFRTKKKGIIDNSKRIYGLEDDIGDIKRVLVMVAKRLDKGNKLAHPNIDSAFEELVKDLLTDEILGTNKCPV